MIVKENEINKGDTDEAIILHANINSITIFQINKRSIDLLHNIENRQSNISRCMRKLLVRL